MLQNLLHFETGSFYSRVYVQINVGTNWLAHITIKTKRGPEQLSRNGCHCVAGEHDAS